MKNWTPKIVGALALLVTLALAQHCNAQRCQCDHNKNERAGR